MVLNSTAALRGSFSLALRKRPVSTEQVGAAIDRIEEKILNLGLRGMEQAATEKGTRIIGSYTERCGTDKLYVGYSVTGIGYILQYAVKESLAGTWKPGYKAFGLAMGPQASAMLVCGATPEMKAKLLEAEKAIREGKIKVLEG